MPVEQFIRNSDNLIKLTLTEDDVAISGAWSSLDIVIGGVTIHRTGDGNGVTLDTTNALLTISPGDLTTGEKDALALLQSHRSYETQIVVTTVLNDDGAVFGGSGSEPLYFHISDKPA